MVDGQAAIAQLPALKRRVFWHHVPMMVHP
jgi:hypothetical protein